jgi:alkylhydroperoxidase family enzyme
MPNLQPLARESLPELEPTFQLTEGFLGFLPNDVLTMAHMPQTTQRFMEFCVSLYREATLPVTLLQLVGLVASAAAGCRYCTAHTANMAGRVNVASEKVAAIWEFETSTLYTDAERAALRLAFNTAQSSATPELFAAAKAHYSESEIVQILIVVCQFGFWNRWNDSVATTLEDGPKAYSLKHLPAARWTPDKHG